MHRRNVNNGHHVHHGRTGRPRPGQRTGVEHHRGEAGVHGPVQQRLVLDVVQVQRERGTRLSRDRSRSGGDRPETTVVASVGIAFGFALLALTFNYSVALGAFLAGSLVAESGVEKKVEHLVQPVRDIFAAVFFVSVGMLIDPAQIVHPNGSRNWAAIRDAAENCIRDTLRQRDAR